MNKVKEFIENVRRHQFWILCGLVALFGVVTWYLGTAKLAEEFAKNKSTVTSAKGTAEAVWRTPDHPNESFTESIETANSTQVKKVEETWKELYARQMQDVQVWPKEFIKDFGNRDAPPKPSPELEGVRNYYAVDVWNQLKGLVAMVDAPWRDPTTNVGRGARQFRAVVSNQDDTTPKHRVEWNDPDWTKSFEFKTPTELQIWYAQEEIWVLEALCKAIAATNADSTGAHDASIKSIEEIVVGFWAAEEAPNGAGDLRVTRLTQVASQNPLDQGAAATGPGMKLPRPVRSTLGDAANGSGMSPGAPAGDFGGAEKTVDDDLKEWRYVDLTGKPLTKDELASVSFHEFRLLPWRLRVTLDQRKLDDFLVAVRNTDLPLQVRQVRINPQVMGGGIPRNTSRDIDDPLLSGITILTVELRGSAYLINPPDISKLSGTGEAGGEMILP